MAIIDIKVRALAPGALDKDIVAVEDSGGNTVRFGFNISPAGTPDAAVVITKVDQNILPHVTAAIVEKRGTVIENNPDWDKVKTDTDGDGAADKSVYNWAQEGQLYEIVM